MSYVVAAWGNPTGWGEADYLLPEGEAVTSRTSLDAISKSLKPDNVLIIVPDTLATAGAPGVEIGGDYQAILDDVSSYMGDWIRNNTSILKECRL